MNRDPDLHEMLFKMFSGVRAPGVKPVSLYPNVLHITGQPPSESKTTSKLAFTTVVNELIVSCLFECILVGGKTPTSLVFLPFVRV